MTYSGQDQTVEVSIDTLVHMVAFAQHWMGRAAEKQGAKIPSDLLDMIADGCARNLGVDEDDFVEAVEDARRTFKAMSMQEEAARVPYQQRAVAAADAIDDTSICASCESDDEDERFGEPEWGQPHPKYNPADYDEDAPVGSMYANHPGYDFSSSGGCMEACDEEDCSSCKFANEHGYQNELLDAL